MSTSQSNPSASASASANTADPTVQSNTQGPQQPAKSLFELHREALLEDVAEALDRVLANMNKLNRNLEQVIAVRLSTCARYRKLYLSIHANGIFAIQVGYEFSSVEALWSKFEEVMAPDPDAVKASGEEGSDAASRRAETPTPMPGKETAGEEEEEEGEEEEEEEEGEEEEEEEEEDVR
jgi:DASH complex subunit DAD1